MRQNIKFFLTLALLKDAETGDYTAYYVQFPEACAQGRTKKEAQKLLDQIFPRLLQSKKDEVMEYHKEHTKSITFVDRPMVSENDNC